MAGYSATPLLNKLDIKAEMRIFLDGAPDGFLSLLGPLPDGVSVAARLPKRADLIHLE